MNPRPHLQPPSRKAVLAGFAAIYLTWGSTYLAIRVAVETLPPFLMAGARFALAGAILMLVLKLRGFALPTAAQWRDNTVIGACLLLGGNALVSWAEQTVPSGLTTLILGASPLIMVLVDWMRPGGSPPTPGLWPGLAVGLGGLILLLGPGALPAGVRLPEFPVVVLLISSTIWWVGSLYSKHAKAGAEPLMSAAAQMICGSALIILAGLVLGEGSRLHLSSVSTRSWVAFAYLVLVGSLLGYTVYVWLLKHCSPAHVSTYAYVNPVVAVFLGWAILGEPLTPRILFAGAAIIAAVVIITTQRSKPEP